MKYVVIDVETTGLDAERHSILSVGAVIEDTEKKLSYEEIPKFHMAILHKEVTGSLYALNMNHLLIDSIVRAQSIKPEERAGMVRHYNLEPLEFCELGEISEKFFYFLYEHGIVPEWDFEVDGREYLNQQVQIINGKRFPIIGARTKAVPFTAAGKNFATFDKKFLEMLPRWKQLMKIKQRIIDPAILYVDWKKDADLPNLGECKERAGFGNHVSHNALEDAWDTLRLLRKFY